MVAMLLGYGAGPFAAADGFLAQMCQRSSPSYDHRNTHPVVCGPFAGDWHWTRSTEQERRVVVSLYNRYCVRCHGVDGKGVWDIPDVPDFTNVRWQQCRTDDQIVRLTIEGRGACMPAFRGTLSIEETWGIARYLRTFSANYKAESAAISSAPASQKPPLDAKIASASQVASNESNSKK